MSIIPVGSAEITHIFGGPSLPTGAAVVYGVDNTPAAGADALALSTHLEFTSEVMPQLSDQVSIQSTICKLGPNSTGPSAEYSEVTGGSLTGANSPPNITYLVRKNTAFGGREGRGRMYLPGVPEAATSDSGQLTTARRDQLQTAVDDWLALMDTNGHQMILLHNSSTIPYVVTTLSVDSRVATQRRRLRR